MIYTVENTSKIGKCVTVRRNGKLVKHCFYADTDNGVVKTYGRKVRLKKGLGEVQSYTNYGRVEVFDVCPG